MNEKLLKYLICPACQVSFELRNPQKQGEQIQDGALCCPKCQVSYPITHGIPRILKDVEDPSTQEAFGFQWERMYDSAKENRENEKYQFDRKIRLGSQEFAGKLVLDAGCGIGRYSYFVAQYGAEVIAIDFSRAVDTAFRYTKGLPGVHIVQTDIFNLPFRPETFDIIMSFGVLHHTPSTKKAFESLVPLTKKEGYLFIWLYAKRSLIVETINNVIRCLTTRLPDNVLYRLSFIPSLFGRIPVLKNLRFLVTFSDHHDFRMRVNDNFDWYNPPYQHLHSCEEVVKWYKDKAFHSITITSPTWFDTLKHGNDITVLMPNSGFPKCLWWLLGRYISVGIRGQRT